LIIELDGGQHNEEAHRTRDEERSNKLHQDGFIVLRFWDNEVLQNLEGVLEKIREVVTTRNLSSSPNPPLKGRE
jgi:very-short-patch-repair endonuclease